MMKVTRVLAAGALAASAALPLAAGVAHAGDCEYTTCGKTPTEVLPQDVSRSVPAVAPAAATAAVQAQQSSSGSLPFTGTDVIELSLIGVGAVAAGTVLVRRTRRAT
ncbi:MAG: hypothetical protein JWO37_1699 [Acidimicrobiales bacterium]|jgi:hypothetical protein|nr:hypothetical protein [Acidimicrobiales bacterium]